MMVRLGRISIYRDRSVKKSGRRLQLRLLQSDGAQADQRIEMAVIRLDHHFIKPLSFLKPPLLVARDSLQKRLQRINRESVLAVERWPDHDAAYSKSMSCASGIS